MPQATVEVIKQAAESQAILTDSLLTITTTIIISGAAAAAWIRRKLSKDSLEIKKETIESDLLQHLEDERDVLKADKEKLLERLLIIDKEKNDAVNKVGQLTVEVEHLRKEVSSLRELIKLMGEKLDNATSTMQKFHIENIKLTSDLSVMKEVFDMKCNSCVHRPKIQ